MKNAGEGIGTLCGGPSGHRQSPATYSDQPTQRMATVVPETRVKGRTHAFSLHLNETRPWAGRAASVTTTQIQPVIQEAPGKPKLR